MNVKMLRSTDDFAETRAKSTGAIRTRELVVRTRSSIREPRLWLGLVLLLGSVMVAHVVLNQGRARVDAVVVSHDLAAGTIVQSQDVVLDSVSAANSTHFVHSLDQVLGHELAQSVYAGDTLRVHDVAGSGSSSLRNVSVLIRAGHLPSLAHGSVVDVWVTPSLEGMAAPGPASLALENIVVDSAPGLVDTTTDSAVTLSVNRVQVQTLVQAMRDGLIDLVVVPGGAE